MTDRDKNWLDGIKAGGSAGQQAFEELSIFYGPKLYSQILKITKDPTLSKDILQEVFIKTWLHLPKFEGRSTLYSWLYRITHNETLNIVRNEKKIVGSFYGYASPLVTMKKIVDMYLTGKINIDSLVRKKFTLDEINEAFEDIDKGEDGRGVIVF